MKIESKTLIRNLILLLLSVHSMATLSLMKKTKIKYYRNKYNLNRFKKKVANKPVK